MHTSFICVCVYVCVICNLFTLYGFEQGWCTSSCFLCPGTQRVNCVKLITIGNGQVSVHPPHAFGTCLAHALLPNYAANCVGWKDECIDITCGYEISWCNP